MNKIVASLFCVILGVVIYQTSAQRFNAFGQSSSSSSSSSSSNSRFSGGFSSFPGFGNFQQQQQKPVQQPQQQDRFKAAPARSGSGVSCPEKTGRFPTRTCDGYIECVDGVGEEKVCPDGLLFNPAVGPFGYPCQYPIDVDCSGREQTQTPQATDDCPHQYGYYRMGGPAECGQFKNCVDGRGFVFDCPEGLAFNEQSYRCDWPDQVASCDAAKYLGFSCPDIPQGRLDTPQEGEYRSYRKSDECQRYFICVNNRPRLYNCGAGMAFNELTNTCDGAENVTGCAAPGQARLTSASNQNKFLKSDRPVYNLEPRYNTRF